MTVNPRRPGFRLPWLSDEEHADSGAPTLTTQTAAKARRPAEAAARPSADAGHDTHAAQAEFEAPPASNAHSVTSLTPTSADAATPKASTASAPAATLAAGGSEPPTQPAADAAPSEFLRELVAAMRGVADHQRESGLSDLKASADERVTRLRTASEERAADLQKRAEVDIAGIGEWAKSEAERIRGEAESRVAARRSQLDEQLAAETRRAELESDAVRTRVAEYERELEAYYARLTEFNDPAAFAAAAKRIPSPPELGPSGSAVAATPPTEAATEPMPAAEGITAAEAMTAAEGTTAADPMPAAEPMTAAQPTAAQPTAAESPAESAPDSSVESVEMPETASEAAPSEEPPAASAEPSAPAEDTDTAQASAPAQEAPETVAASDESAPAPAAEAQTGESRTTSIIVKGLASFGAITGFRQSLAALEGIEGVQLSLGPTGEFVYRATHPEGLDIEAAIGTLEGGSAQVNREEDGTVRVTVNRGR